MTHSIKAGDRFRATAPNGDVFEGTAIRVEGCNVLTKYNYFVFGDYNFVRLSTPLATKVGALYGPDEENSPDFLVRTEGPDTETSYPWFINSPSHKAWLTDKAATGLVQERGWVRRDDGRSS